MAIIKSFAPFQNLSNFQTFLVDDSPLSEYFRITEFKETFTGGKNGFLIEGSEFLKETTEVKIELLDVAGNPIYFEPGDGIPEYYEGTSKLISVHVYDDTPIGLGKITILGELKNYVDGNGSIVPVPSEWKGVYNVKWQRTFKVNKNLNNEDIVRFYKRPLINIEELVKPIFSQTVLTSIDTGSVSGVPQLPVGGTNLSTWRAGTFYKLVKSSGSWDRDVDENVITISSLNYSPTIIEVLNDREVLVNIPYSDSNNLVQPFTSQSFSVTYQDFANEVLTDSALTGSFAKIDITQLKTFVGDVARVKVFRKSRSSANDFQFVQESKLESTELLKDIYATGSTEIPYGRFDQYNLSTYWVTSSIDHPTTIDSSVLSQAVKVDYNGSGVQQLITSQSFSLSKDVEYTLDFRTLLSGSAVSGKSLKAYFSGSYTNTLGNPATYIQNFLTISGSGEYNVRQNVSQNILADRNIDAKLVFEFIGDDWYVSNVSLKNAQDTSFSPDEFTLIQDIPRKLANETFDFRFEFYDINNNYIPVTVTATKEFNGGNDFPTSAKLLTFESDRNAFRYSSGSANPESQQIQFKVTRQNLTGSVVYDWKAYNQDGDYLTQSIEWIQYPGELTNPNDAGALLSVVNFEGIYDTASYGVSPEVYSIIYTASLEGLEEFETVYRLEDGDNSPTLLVTSNANQFIYEPTTLSPKPSGQSITIRAQRKNLASLSTPITINSGSNLPPLTYVDTVNGVDTYTISALQFSSSFAANNFDEVTYEFTGSDVFNEEQTDEITLSKVINFDGVSITLSNESTAFRANSVGKVLDEFSAGDGVVEMRIGNVEIEHNDGLTTPNRFDIIGSTVTNVTESNPLYSDDTYGITGISADSGNIVLSIQYLAGDGVTSQTFQKKVNYTKNRIAPPTITIDTTNKTQNVDAKSTGVQITSFEDSLVTVKEIYTGSITTFTSGDVGVTFDLNPNTIASENNLLISYDNLISSSDSTQVQFTATVIDSEGEIRTISDSVSLSKSKKGAPVLSIETTNKDQSITAKSTGEQTGSFQNSVVVVKEQYNGVTTPITTFSPFTVTRNDTSNPVGTSSNTILLSSETLTNGVDSTTVSIETTVTDSEGTSRVITDTIALSKVKKAAPSTLVTISPISQTITSSSLAIGDPNDVIVSVSEGTNLYSYNGGSLGDSQFNITSLSLGTDSNGTISFNNGDFGTGTLTVNYKNSEGSTTSQNLSFDISVAAAGVSGSNGESGSTGPGIVFRGPYDNATSYQFDVSNGRRDSVLYNDIYYVTLQPTTGNAPTGFETDNAYWQSLGTQDFFVAAKIAIFEESFIKNTLNIGLNAAGDTANITLAGGTTSPYLSIGQSPTGVYGANGIFLGQDLGASKFSVSNSSSGNYLKWTGTDLDISGDLNFGNGDTISQGGTFSLGGGNVTWNGSSLNITGDITVTNTSEFADPLAEPNDPNQDNPTSYSFGPSADFILNAITPATDGLYLGNNNMGYYNNGWKTFMDGFGNFFLSGTNQGLTWNAGTDTLTVDGTINAQSGTFSGNITSTATISGGTLSGGTISGGSINIGSNAFTVATDGELNIGSGQFIVYPNGNVYSDGNIIIDTNAYFGFQTFASEGWSGTINGITFKPYYIDDLIPSLGGPGSIADFGSYLGSGKYIRGYVRRTSGGSYSYDRLEIFGGSGTGGTGGTWISGNVYATGNITAYYSDDRLKTRLGNITNPLEKINTLNGFQFQLNEEGKSLGLSDESIQIGVSAQEVQNILPEIVKPAPVNENYLTVQYERLVPLLIEGIKELTSKVENLEKELKKLKGE